MKNSNIKQILLLGCDVSKDFNSINNSVTISNKYMRSDANIVAIINKNTNKVALVYLMRDILVNIEGFGQDRLNTAILRGGPNKAIEVVNEHFNLDIDDYIVLNMENLVKIVDELGGIDIILDDEEIYYINEEINDVKSIVGYTQDIVPIKEPGINHLNGVQTLTHTRNRFFGYTWKRAERQKEVLKAMMKKAKNLNKKEMLKFGIKMMKYVKTSLSIIDIIELAKIALKVDVSSIDTLVIPSQGTYNQVNDVIWHFDIDFFENSILIQELIDNL